VLCPSAGPIGLTTRPPTVERALLRPAIRAAAGVAGLIQPETLTSGPPEARGSLLAEARRELTLPRVSGQRGFRPWPALLRRSNNPARLLTATASGRRRPGPISPAERGLGG